MMGCEDAKARQENEQLKAYVAELVKEIGNLQSRVDELTQENAALKRACTRPRKRESVVQYALKPLLRALKIDDRRAGLHAFRHGLATELAEAAVSIPVLQTQRRHADVRTTLRVYAHVIPQSQREAMERVSQAIGTNVPIGT
jgi:integrase